jgi:hypothetical protein
MIAFRPMEPQDRAFVIGSWVDSSRTANCAGQIAMEDWDAIMTVQIGKVLDRPAQVIVAHDPSDDEPGLVDLLGFIAYDVRSFRLPFVYYVYVKQNYRRWGYDNGTRVGDGIARRLFAAAGIEPSKPFQYSGNTRKVRKLERKVPLARWAPLLARFPLEAARRHDADADY